MTRSGDAWARGYARRRGGCAAEVLLSEAGEQLGHTSSVRTACGHADQAAVHGSRGRRCEGRLFASFLPRFGKEGRSSRTFRRNGLH